MTENEFFESLQCRLYPTLSVEGVQIPRLEGLFFKPLDAIDSIAIEDFTEKHGADTGFAISFARALVNADGTRVISDDGALRLTKPGAVLGGVIGPSLRVIRAISGSPEGAEDQKKIHSCQETERQTITVSPLSSASPNHSPQPSAVS